MQNLTLCVQLAEGKVSDTAYYTAAAVDTLASVASIAIGGRVVTGVASKAGGGAWGSVAGSAAEAALATVILKEGEVISYQLTDPGKLDSNYWKRAMTELTVSTVVGGGFGLLGSLMSGELRGNYKIMANSPNELNPTQFKVVQPIASVKSAPLLGSAADSTGGSVLNHVGGVMQTPGKGLIELPKTASLTVDDAVAWQHALAGDLELMVNKKASQLEQAIQAVQLKNDFMIAARNAMDDGNAAAQLNLITPTRTFEEMVAARAKKMSGDALYKQIIADAKLEMVGVRDVSAAISKDGFCFAAGTLVHGKEGLIPIESIKIGDWVLAQPEETGAQAFKRVVRTTRFDDKSVVRVRCYSSVDGVEQVQTFITTGNHPFYVKHHDTTDVGGRAADDAKKPTGWTRADLLEFGALLELADGKLITVTAVDPVWRTTTEGVGWIGDRDAEVGHYIDLRNGQIQETFGGLNNSDLAGVDDFNERYEDEELTDKWAYKCAVYNFEVEDFHTYYVGELGIWVHNTNCFEQSIKALKRNGKLTSPDLEVYFSISDVNALIKTMPKPKGMVLVYEGEGIGSVLALQ